MARVPLVCLVLAICCITTHAQFDTSHYTKYRVGERLPSTINLNGSANLLCFASESSCFLCMESLQSMEQWVNQLKCVRMRLFLAAPDDSSVKALKSKYKWRFDVVGDPLGVIHTGFGLLNTPFYYLVSGEGVILAMGSIGSKSNDWPSTADLMSKLCSSTKTTGNLELVKQIVVKCKGSDLAPTLQRQAQTYNRGNSHVVSLTGTGELLFVEGDTCVFGGKSGKIFPQPLSYTVVMTSSVVDSMCFIYDMPTSAGSLPYVRIVDAGKMPVYDTIRLGKYPYRSWIFASASRSGSFVASTLRPTQLFDSAGVNVSSKDTLNTIVIDAFGTESKSLSFAGARELIFNEYDLSGYFWQCMSFKGDSVLLHLSNLSDTLRFHNLVTGTVGSIPISFDTTIWRTEWRRHARRMGDSTTLDFQKGLSKHASALHAVLYDETTEDIYVAFLNRDFLGSNAQYYITGPIGSKSCTTHPVPDRAAPHSMFNGLLYTTSVVDGTLQVRSYRLPPR